MVWKFLQVRVIEGQFTPREPKLVRVIGSFEISRVREIGGEIIELEWSKSRGNKVWFEISGGSGNRGFEKLGLHCILASTSVFVLSLSKLVLFPLKMNISVFANRSHQNALKCWWKRTITREFGKSFVSNVDRWKRKLLKTITRNRHTLPLPSTFSGVLVPPSMRFRMKTQLF